MLHHMFIFDQSCTLKSFQWRKRESFQGWEDGVKGGRKEGGLEVTLCRRVQAALQPGENRSTQTACTKALERKQGRTQSPYSVRDCSPHLKSCKRNPVPSTELLSLATQNQVPPRGTCNDRAQACSPRGTPNSQLHEATLPSSPPYKRCGFCEKSGPSGPQVCVQETWFSSHLHRFCPCVELCLINSSVRKGKSCHVWDHQAGSAQRGWQEHGCWCTVWEHGLRGWIASCFYSIIVSVKS